MIHLYVVVTLRRPPCPSPWFVPPVRCSFGAMAPKKTVDRFARDVGTHPAWITAVAGRLDRVQDSFGYSAGAATATGADAGAGAASSSGAGAGAVGAAAAATVYGGADPAADEVRGRASRGIEPSAMPREPLLGVPHEAAYWTKDVGSEMSEQLNVTPDSVFLRSPVSTWRYDRHTDTQPRVECLEL